MARRISATLGEPPSLAVAGLHLAVLWSFAFAQPLLDVLANSPDFFVARGNQSADILILALGLLILPPLAMLLAEGLAGLLWRPLRAAGHLLLIGLLFAAIALQVLADRVDVPAGALLVAVALIGTSLAIAYALFRFLPSLLTVLGIAPPLFAILFLLASPVSKLVLPGERAAVASTSLETNNPVVVLVFDELPTISLLDGRGRIDRTRFPSFAKLADTATWYRNATTTVELTSRAVPGILSGSTPEKGTLPIASELPDNLFTLFGGSYRLAVNETHTALCPEDLCEARPGKGLAGRLGDLVEDLAVVSGHLLLPDSFDDELPSVTETFGDFAGDGDGDAEQDAEPPARMESERDLSLANADGGGRVRPLLAMLDAIDASDRSLYFAHLSLPHVPWNFLPDGSRYPLATEMPGFEPGEDVARWTRSRPLIRPAQQRHLLQLGFADRLLGSLIDRLRREGIWDRALVAVVADHGASFVPGEYRRVPTERNLAAIANVPLLVKAPGQRRGRIVDARVRTIDLLPTIAHELGVQLPFEVEGRPAPGGGAPAGLVTVESRYGELISARLADVVRARDRLARRQARELGAGGGWPALYRSGPHAELIGAEVGALPLAGGSVGELRLDQEPADLELRPGARKVPALISGSLSGPIETETPVAVAVNGRVAAIGVTYADGDEARLIAMVPPDAYRVGANRVAAFTILPGGRLQRLDDAG